MWDLIVSIPDHCLSFYFLLQEDLLPKMDELRSKRHRVYGQHMNKVSSVPFDSKHWLTENEVGVSEMDAVIDELLSV